MSLDNDSPEQKLTEILANGTFFTADWFSYAVDNFKEVKRIMGSADSILEIGSHEGMSSCWMLQELLSDTGTITCIDPWANEPLSAFDDDVVPDNRIIERVFRSNTDKARKAGQTLEVMPDLSFNALAQLITQGRRYDFIYVDGSHDADAVLTDACMCFGLLKPGGIMLFDDYLWPYATDALSRPKMSIDAFVNMFTNRINIGIQNYQLSIQKKPKEKL